MSQNPLADRHLIGDLWNSLGLSWLGMIFAIQLNVSSAGTLLGYPTGLLSALLVLPAFKALIKVNRICHPWWSYPVLVTVMVPIGYAVLCALMIAGYVEPVGTRSYH